MTIYYHTRLDGTDTKLVGGAREGTLQNILEDFTVEFTPTGRAIFIDSKNRRVNVYTKVDPSDHPGYAKARADYQKKQRDVEEEISERQKKIEKLLNALSDEEIIKRLS
jgi:hypothetical protein